MGLIESSFCFPQLSNVENTLERYMDSHQANSGGINLWASNLIDPKRPVSKDAHLLLQIRTRVLNDELRDEFFKWYPSFAQENENHSLAA